MEPVYQFRLDADIVFPVWADGLSKEMEREGGEQFFREKLSGKIVFRGADYTRIVSASFEHQFGLYIGISYNGGLSFSNYFRGQFYKTDCEFDDDAQTVSVVPRPLDRYSAVMAGIGNEYNLIDLAPEIGALLYDKRPIVQIYVPGRSVFGCFLGGMYWEEKCDPVTDEGQLIIGMHFSQILNPPLTCVGIEDNKEQPNYIVPNGFSMPVGNVIADKSQVFGNYRFEYHAAVSDTVTVTWRILRNSDNVILWQAQNVYASPAFIPSGLYSIELTPQYGGLSPITLHFEDVFIYERIITTKSSSTHVTLYPIQSDDPFKLGDSAYNYVGPSIVVSGNVGVLLSDTPTSYGIYEPGKYFLDPDANGEESVSDWFPIARTGWSRFSFWGRYSNYDYELSYDLTTENTVPDCYLLWSVIAVLLNKIAPGVTHENTAQYSQFFYGDGAYLPNFPKSLLITPKTNIITGGYDEAARQAPITLRAVLDMLRDCFKCYWYIDDNNRFRIEHLRYFRNGLSYSSTPGIAVDLTTEATPRLGVPWGYGQNKFTYDKFDMPERFQFKWMDSGVTRPFEGYPIEMVAGYVEQGKVEEINIGLFTSDIDYIVLLPENISKDGFVLLGADDQGEGVYKLPYMTFSIEGNQFLTQNGYVAMEYLQRYYAYELPAWVYRIHNYTYQALGVVRAKTQKVEFPAYRDPDILELIKTNIGNGTIQKLSINLSSRHASATINFEFEK